MHAIHSKKKVFSQTPQKGSVDVKKRPNDLKCRKKLYKNSTKPIKVLHLDTAKEPSPRSFFKVSYKT